ncbi:MAG: segregation/condensation protein A [DPANN group archaeon]|nr:segregation/condensation protein A [DPANN group archaeon]
MQEQIFDILFNEDEITWQSIIFDLIRENKLDPWDIDLSMLAGKFLEMLKTFKKMDFRISGKILLAAAILLRIKSNKLFDDYVADFDRIISSDDTLAEEFYEELEAEAALNMHEKVDKEFKLIPRTPQPRKRKVSVFDLVDALQKALEVQERRLARPRSIAPKVTAPTDHMDISMIIDSIYSKVVAYYANSEERLSFSALIPSESKEDKVYTFIPLLHLDNQQRVDLNQKEQFGEIFIDLMKDDPKQGGLAIADDDKK